MITDLYLYLLTNYMGRQTFDKCEKAVSWSNGLVSVFCKKGYVFYSTLFYCYFKTRFKFFTFFSQRLLHLQF